MLRNIRLRDSARSKKDDTQTAIAKYVNIGRMLLLIVLMCILRNLLFLRVERERVENALGFTDNSVKFWTYLDREQEEKRDMSYFEFQTLEDNRYKSVDIGKMFLKTSTYPKLDVGQVCLISGDLVEPESFDGFDYKTYLKNKNIFTVLENAKLKCLPISDRREGNVVFNKLIDFKNSCVKIIDKNLPEPQSSLLAGIIFGQERAFSEEFETNTRISGVSHIVAASGYNITVLVLAVNRLFFFLKKKPRILLSICVLWCFCIISGLSSSIIRASIMSTVALLAILLGRNNSIHISLPLASLLFVIINPVIIFDVGFQLSILATMGLIYLSPSLEVFFQKAIKRELPGFLKEYILTTLSCTLVTLPISISTFKTFSIWSVLANTLILPTVESTMLWGVFGVIGHIINPVIGKFFFLVTYVQLKYFELVVSGIGSLGVGYWEVGEVFSWIFVLLVSVFILIISISFYPINNEEINHYLEIS